MSLNQITDWIGKEVTVEITGNKTVKGTLAFFNYNCQVGTHKRLCYKKRRQNTNGNRTVHYKSIRTIGRT